MSDQENKDREFIRTVYQKCNEARDAALLSLSSAALGFSLSFYDKFFHGHCYPLLVLTWIMLGICVLALIYSHHTGGLAHYRLDWFKNEAHLQNDERFKASLHRLANATHWLNITALSAFTLSLISLILLAVINTGEIKPMTDSITTRPAPPLIEKGIVPLPSLMPMKTGGSPATVPASPPPAAPAAPSK